MLVNGVMVFKTKTFELVKALDNADYNNNTVAYAANGEFLACGGMIRVPELWHTKTWSKVQWKIAVDDVA